MNTIRSFSIFKYNQNCIHDDYDDYDIRKSIGYFATDEVSIEGSFYFINKIFSQLDSDVKKYIIVIPTIQDIKNKD